MVISAWKLSQHKTTGALAYEKAPWPSWAGYKETFNKAAWWGKFHASHDYFVGLRSRGGWGGDESVGRHWQFLVGDFTKFAYLYCVWLLFKKIALTANVAHIDGEANAWVALGLQLVDTVLVVFCIPFNDMQTTGVEALAGLSNALAYFCIAMPVLDIVVPELALPLELQLVIAALGSIMTGASAFVGSILRFMKSLLICAGAVSPPLPTIDLPDDNVALNVVAGAGAGGLVAGFLMDEAVGQARRSIVYGVGGANGKGEEGTASGQEGKATPEEAEEGFVEDIAADGSVDHSKTLSSASGSEQGREEADPWGCGLFSLALAPLVTTASLSTASTPREPVRATSVAAAADASAAAAGNRALRKGPGEGGEEGKAWHALPSVVTWAMHAARPRGVVRRRQSCCPAVSAVLSEM